MLRGKNKVKDLLGGIMKKVFGILMVACICIALGLSVKWSRDRNVSLVDGRITLPFADNGSEN